MNDTNQKQLGKTLWNIADQLRGAMNADDFRDYMLSFLFLRYLSDNYETAAKKELGKDYAKLKPDESGVPLKIWYKENKKDVSDFEKQMRRKVHYVIQPSHLWNSIAEMARTQNGKLLNTLQAGFKYIENESFESTFNGLFSEINLGSDKLGRKYEDRNTKLCSIIAEIAKGLAEFSSDIDALGDAYEYLIGQFAAGSGKKAGEFYTPQQISDILSTIVTLDSQEPASGKKDRLASVLDFACGSGSLLLNVRKRMGPHATYQFRKQELRYSRRVDMAEIEKNDFNLNISRYISTAVGEDEIELGATHSDLLGIEKTIQAATAKHNQFLKELGLSPLP